jgi:isopentenyl diphosphate isomerase/L-lactate dehydrogenase-like FMN-dependent dehydrogenase
MPAWLDRLLQVSQLNPEATWSEVAFVRSIYNGPLIIKGVLHPDEVSQPATFFMYTTRH